MYRLFLDESYGHDHFYIAGVLVDDKQAHWLNAALEDTATRLQERNQWEKLPEFHGHALMNAQEDWTRLHPYFGARLNIYTQILHLIDRSGARVFIQGVDVRRLNARYTYPRPPYEATVSRLLGVVDEYCALTGSTCVVVADEREDYSERESIEGRFTWKLARPLAVMGEHIEFRSSYAEYGIQAADMCAYIARRYLEQHSEGEAVKRSKRRLYRALEPCLEYVEKWLP